MNKKSQIFKETNQNFSIINALASCKKLNHDWNEKNGKECILSIIEYLRQYDEELGLAQHTYIHDRALLKVSFINSGFAYCLSTGELQFGSRVFLNDLTYESFGYVKEKPFIKERCKTRIQGLIWLVLHEYCHLFKDHIRHKKSFYEFIDKKYLKFFLNF